MRDLLRKSVLGRRNTCITALALTMIIILSSLPSVASLLTGNLTIQSSGVISYNDNSTRPLHVEGRYIKDDLGNIVYLRGIHKAGFEDDHTGWWSPVGSYQGGFGVWDPDTVKANLDAMKSWGANIVRLIMSLDWWIDDYGNHRQHVKDICDFAAERGMYVMYVAYCVHHYEVGEPWDQVALPYPPYLMSGDERWIPDEAAFVDFWGSVAQELGSKQNVLFHLFGEPCGMGYQHDEDAKNSWFNVAQQCIDRIRQIENTNGYIKHLIIFQYRDSPWCNLDHPDYDADTMEWVGWPETPEGENIVYSTSFYREYDSCGLHDDYSRGWTYDECKLAMEIQKIDWVVNTLNKSFMVAEVGANLWHSGQELNEELKAFENCLKIWNEWGISYLPLWWRIEGPWALLQDDVYIPPPSETGQIFIDCVAAA